jgi:Serine aminopeptidase, S33
MPKIREAPKPSRPRWRRYARWLLIGPLVWAAILAGLIMFGTAAPPPPLAAISGPMRRLDLSDLPPARHYPARDGTMLAFRSYGAGDAVIVLVHGASGSSQDMHALAKALSAAGASIYAIDARGHGGSGRRGDIDYMPAGGSRSSDSPPGVDSRYASAAAATARCSIATSCCRPISNTTRPPPARRIAMAKSGRARSFHESSD